MLRNEFNQTSSALPHCPKTCEALFGKLEDGSSDGNKVQEVEVQIRGEPKSGTGMTQVSAWNDCFTSCHQVTDTEVRVFSSSDVDLSAFVACLG